MPDSVLLVGPPARVRQWQNSCLGEPPFELKVVANPVKAMALARQQPPAAIVLVHDGVCSDLMQTCHEFRRLGPYPIIVVCDGLNPELTVNVLECGADDVLPADVSPRELRARVRAHLRRALKYGTVEQSQIRLGDLEIDRDHHLLRKNNREVALSPKEFALLEYLIDNPDRVVRREEILRDVWELPAGIRSRTLDVHMARLRQKLSQLNAPVEIVTIPCVGYRLRVFA
ncbi:MAG: response regulator transcription factor [Armatimonadetes bacterium]|nr:response regulator transcription factor [Armatimonadota bacterium]